MRRRDSDARFKRATLVTVEEREAWDGSSRCCTADAFKVDLQGTPANGWNKSAARVFCKHFRASKQYRCKDKAKIISAFTTHLKQLKRRYQRASMSQNEVREKLRRQSRAQRRNTLFSQRLTSAVQYPQLRHHVGMLRKLGTDGMSSDEPDRDIRGQFLIHAPPYRSSKVTVWLRVFDHFYRRYRESKGVGPGSGRGALPRIRLDRGLLSDRPGAVSGLPANCYSLEWFERLNEFEKEDLEVDSAEYILEHEPRVMS
ncbi:uncharacterized protein B0H18DRAFT_868110 [Fomitopsis serialis]|uniref:uncharacterized protein n=1 Tax=Fomitopsis serialis TaxID=139415 RepID=UPI0020078AB9|nr:uncharacterized protein B0H18DRAFT_868110 [Neoantrodia serialis]KAH9936464.1 hypothetical protein B0H18DRAFT_868110 [Neoantrodia serialis]